MENPPNQNRWLFTGNENSKLSLPLKFNKEAAFQKGSLCFLDYQSAKSISMA